MGSIVGWIILGGIAGCIASIIARTDGLQGYLGNIFVGILGGLISGFLWNLFGVYGAINFDVNSLIISAIGSVLLVWVWRTLAGYQGA